MMSFFRRYPAAAALLLGVALALALLACVEGVCWLAVRRRATSSLKRVLPPAGTMQEPHDLLGYRPLKNWRGRALKKSAELVAYECIYSTDEFHRRSTPITAPEKRDRFALFFGGSFTFGEGVNDDETLPAQFGQAAPGFMPYNYGFQGYGPQSMYAHLLRDGFKDEIRQRRGIAVYVFITRHVARAIGAYGVVKGWGRHLPCFRGESGQLIHRGTFERCHPLRQGLYDLLARSNTLAYLQFDYPYRYRTQDWILTARLIIKSSRRLKALFDQVTFYVLFYPGRSDPQYLKPLLEQADIHCLGYSGLLVEEPGWPHDYFLADGHPAALTCRRVAQQLAQDIRPDTQEEAAAQRGGAMR